MRLPELHLSPAPSFPPPPDDAACVRLWDKYGMLPHIRDHCRTVAAVAGEIARRARAAFGAGGADAGPVGEAAVRAAALLHDIAKTYTIRHGGGHAQLGAAWVRDETGHAGLAQAVLFHVSWPWKTGPLAPEADPLRLPLIISYADKRVRHDRVVSLEERFADLLVRYGDTEEHRASLRRNREQARILERALFARVGEL